MSDQPTVPVICELQPHKGASETRSRPDIPNLDLPLQPHKGASETHAQLWAHSH